MPDSAQSALVRISSREFFLSNIQKVNETKKMHPIVRAASERASDVNIPKEMSAIFIDK